MTQAKVSLWQTIEALAQEIPFSKAKVEALLSTQLTETDNSGNDVFLFYKSHPIDLADGVVVSNIDLRIKRTGPHPGFLVLEIEGACVGIDESRKHYDQLEITDTPRGRSLDDVTSHTATLPWGELSFSFKERNPECLSSIAFEPK